MQIFDLKSMQAYPYEQRDKNVFYRTDEFKVRIIELKKEEKMPPHDACKMESNVIFYVVWGTIGVTINEQYTELHQGQCIISEPAIYQIEAKEPSRVMGIQINKG